MIVAGCPRHAAALALLALALSTHAVAAKWTITPDISVIETYTDNPTLDASGTEDDFVTRVTPGIRIDGTGARFRANLSYRPSAIFYARHSREDRISSTLSAFGNLEAVENLFFVDATGNISQNFISPFAPQPAEITTTTSNRTETRTFGISPYIRGRAGSAFSYELRNRNTWTSTDNAALADVQTTHWSGRIASPIRLFGWALEYDDSRISYDGFNDRPDQNSRLYRGRLYFQPDSTLRLSASAGHEENDYALQQERSYDIYGAGLSWKPTARTSAELEWERRFFGPSRLASLKHRTRLSAWTLTYSKDASSFQRELLTLPPGNAAELLDAIFAARIPDPLERQAAVEQFLRASGTPDFLASSLAFYTQQIFLQERLEGSVGILGRRNSVTLTAFRSQTTSLSDSAGAALPEVFLFGNRVKQQGFGLRFNHRVTPFTTLGASATRTNARQEEPSSLGSRNDNLSLSLNQTVSRKTTVFAGLSLSSFSSDAPSADRDARSAFVGLHHRF